MMEREMDIGHDGFRLSPFLERKILKGIDSLSDKVFDDASNSGRQRSCDSNNHYQPIGRSDVS